MHLLECVQLTAASPSFPSFSSRLGMTDQSPPFQLSVRVLPTPADDPPTAIQVVELVQETPERPAVPLKSGVAVIDHGGVVGGLS